MKILILLMLLVHSIEPQLIIDFSKESTLQNWFVVDDGVMGGLSAGNFEIDDLGHGVFKGTVSLDNNGGFSSVRHVFDRKSVVGYSKVVLKVKGDGKNYQFRLRENARDYYSYIYTFNTSGDWQEIEINLEDMYPSYRGRRLDMPNFSAESIEGLTILVGNKKAEEFELMIDKIRLEK